MLRPPFPGHRRYSITHRAVQRLRELVRTLDEDDDESVRDRLDGALSSAEDGGRAIRTLDAMLGEPQTLIPIEDFGEMLYAIIKEETVVTVLPQGHGEEILQRGQAMEQRVGPGPGRPAPREREVTPPAEDRWEPRRRWRQDNQPVVVERIERRAGPGGGIVSRIESVGSIDSEGTDDNDAAPVDEFPERPTERAREAVPDATKVVPLQKRVAPNDPVAAALQKALDRASRRATVAALGETLSLQHKEASLVTLWNILADEGVPQRITVGDLIEAANRARN